jgi:transcriptional regulator with XRE-family HTH domain
MVTAPPVRRRLVGSALRRYRENLGYTLDDAARTLECDRSKISRIETGQRGIRGKELRELLAEYGIGDEQQKILVALAARRDPSGWHHNADVLPGAWQDYLILEAFATKIVAYEPQRIPALLQTPAYARELAEADPALVGSDARDSAVAAVLARQQAILGERKPDIHLIIGEAALRQEVGGPEVMEGQLGLLAGISGDSGTVTVQVLPFSSRAHAAAGVGSLAMLGFDQVPGLGVVHLGGASGGVCLESQGPARHSRTAHHSGPPCPGQPHGHPRPRRCHRRYRDVRHRGSCR